MDTQESAYEVGHKYRSTADNCTKLVNNEQWSDYKKYVCNDIDNSERYLEGCLVQVSDCC